MVAPEIELAIDALDALFGARPPVLARPLLELYASGRMDALVARIGSHMGLPINFTVSVASKDVPFRSHYLARTDRTGRAVGGIEAQVTIPRDLPLFGSAELTGYPIGVLVTPGFASAPKPETAIAILAHEVSHVLLHALRHPQRESELVTDLVPLVLGFGEIVERGRLLAWDTQDGRVTTTNTVRYGYLSDADFEAARRRTESLRRQRQKQVRRLRRDLVECQRLTARAAAAVARFGELMQRVDADPRRVRSSDAERVVALHAADATDDIERAIQRARATASKLQPFVRASADYLKAPATLQEHQQELTSALSSLRTDLRPVLNDLALLARNCGRRFQIDHWIRLVTGP